MSHVLQWQLSLLLALRVASVEPPHSEPRSVFCPLPPPPSPAPLRSFDILSGVSAPLQFPSCLLWRRHTRKDEYRTLHACLSATVRACVRVCASVRSQHMLSSVDTKASRARDAVRAVWGHSTSSVNPSPERMRASPFWAPSDRWERGVNSTEHCYTQCHHRTLRARCQKWTICSVPGGRSAIIFSCFLEPLLLLARVLPRLVFMGRLQLSDKSVWCLQAVRLAVIMVKYRAFVWKLVCTLCRFQKHWMLLNMRQITYRFAIR